jgi:hypothetical protein
MTKKSLRQWIKENRQDIDAIIKRHVPDVKLNDEERRIWVLNDEGLYLWAKRERVNI